PVVCQPPPGTTSPQALPEPPPTPWPWMPDWELEPYVPDYAASGFHGGVNWYLTGDANWEYRRARAANHTTVPSFFFGSEADVDLLHWHGEIGRASCGERGRV